MAKYINAEGKAFDSYSDFIMSLMEAEADGLYDVPEAFKKE